MCTKEIYDIHLGCIFEPTLLFLTTCMHFLDELKCNDVRSDVLIMDKLKVEKAIFDLLVALGEDVSRDGLIETPKRVANMYEEILSGRNSNPSEHLKFFDGKDCASEVVVVKDIPFYSICEHHLLPFFGKVSLAYLPKGEKILGLSKFARIVDCFAKRLQVQERLTTQIGEFIFESGEVDGVAVVVEAEHLCMTMRGIKAFGAKTETVALCGILKEDQKKRNDVLDMLKRGF